MQVVRGWDDAVATMLKGEVRRSPTPSERRVFYDFAANHIDVFCDNFTLQVAEVTCAPTYAYGERGALPVRRQSRRRLPSTNYSARLVPLSLSDDSTKRDNGLRDRAPLVVRLDESL